MRSGSFWLSAVRRTFEHPSIARKTDANGQFRAKNIGFSPVFQRDPNNEQIPILARANFDKITISGFRVLLSLRTANRQFAAFFHAADRKVGALAAGANPT
jgi:hypothetical protein